MDTPPGARKKTSVSLALLLTIFCGLALIVAQESHGGEESLVKSPDRAYLPDPAAIAFLQQFDRPVEIVLFHGAWCKDCRREVPRFMRILELAENPHFTLTEYEVTPEKKDVLGKFEEYDIKRVPTFIVIREGRELGRIIEAPEKSLEDDLVSILKDQK